MRRLIWFAATALVLVGAGIAVAHDSSTYATSRGDYTGTAVSTDSTLNGNASVSAESVINTTTGFGTVNGKLRIQTADGKHTVAQFDAVYTNGHIVGLAEGHGSQSWSKLVANLSADFTAAGGFANGKLGGTTGGDAVEVTSGGCKPASSSKPDTIQVHGAITAVSATSITAAGVTCVVPATLATAVGALHVGDRVELKCTVSGTTNTLTKVEGDKHDD